MKKRLLIILLSLAAVICAGLGFTGCAWLSGLDPNHTHVPASSWNGDSTYHWHECVALGCSEQLDKAEHTLIHVAAKEVTCTEDGNVEYWYCTGCQKSYSDSGATTEIKTVVIKSRGHIVASMHDETTHWYECYTCHTVTIAAEAHSCPTYVKNKSGHYKICSVCEYKYDEGTHTDGEDCTICGYTPDYADKCASDYGYNYLGTLAGGVKYQSFYEKMDEVVKGFHNDETKTATPVYTGSGVFYVACQVDYASSGLTTDQAQCVWTTYRNDHPLYYWLIGQVVTNSQSLSICVDSDYKDGSTRVKQNELINTAIDAYLAVGETETSAYQTAFAYHDMIIENISYALNGSGSPETANWAHSILGVFNGESAVCEGYAKAFALLLNASGIDNVYVTGSSKGVGHAWNMVKLDGAWYWYDLTWDDQPLIGGGIIYDYMCRPGEEFADHQVGETGNIEKPMSFLYAIPVTATTEYNSSLIECGEQFTIGNYTYEVCGYNKASLVGVSSTSGALALADSVTYAQRTYTVTEIGANAFSSSRWITSLTISQTVKVIYNKSFVNCFNLKNVTFADKTGWCRIPNDGVTTVFSEVSESSLQSSTGAATLLKETYVTYTYTWVKSLNS